METYSNLEKLKLQSKRLLLKLSFKYGSLWIPQLF